MIISIGVGETVVAGDGSYKSVTTTHTHQFMSSSGVRRQNGEFEYNLPGI